MQRGILWACEFVLWDQLNPKFKDKVQWPTNPASWERPRVEWGLLNCSHWAYGWIFVQSRQHTQTQIERQKGQKREILVSFIDHWTFYKLDALDTTLFKHILVLSCNCVLFLKTKACSNWFNDNFHSAMFSICLISMCLLTLLYLYSVHVTLVKVDGRWIHVKDYFEVGFHVVLKRGLARYVWVFTVLENMIIVTVCEHKTVKVSRSHMHEKILWLKGLTRDYPPGGLVQQSYSTLYRLS